MKRGGGFEFDQDILEEQKKNIHRISAMREFDEMEDRMSGKNNNNEEEKKSLTDLMRENRERNEQIISSKQPAAA